MAEERGENGELERELRRLKFQRRGKKAAITIRIQKLEKLMEPNNKGEYTKRRIVSGALNALIKVFDELQQVCHEISQISEDDDLNDLEMVRLDIDMCSTTVMDYLESRADDTTSSGSLTSSWLDMCGPTIAEFTGALRDGSVCTDPDVNAAPQGVVPETPERHQGLAEDGLETVQVMQRYGEMLRSGDSVSSVEAVREESLEDPEKTSGNTYVTSNTSLSADGEVSYVS